MATTYVLTGTGATTETSVGNALGGDFDSEGNTLPTAPTGAATLSIINITTTAFGTARFATAAGDPGSAGGSGAKNYTVEINVTTSNMNISSARVYLARLNSAGFVQTNSSEQTFDASSTGIKTVTFTSVDLGTFGSTDRFGVLVFLIGSSTMGQTVAIETGTVSAEVVAPWNLSSTTAPPMPRYPARGLVMRGRR